VVLIQNWRVALGLVLWVIYLVKYGMKDPLYSYWLREKNCRRKPGITD
jgi:hypothetical protein